MRRDRRRVAYRSALAVAALLLIAASEQCGGETAVVERAYIVFVDLSLSLSHTQTDVLPRVVDTIVQGMPGGSRVTVFPIGEKVVATGPLLQTTLPRGENATERVRLQKRRSEITPALIAAIAEMRSTLRPGTMLRHTCISDALRQAAKEARDVRGAGVDELEIIFISDMLEDCEASLLGGPVSLEKKDIRAEIAISRALPVSSPLVDLGRGRVTMLLPPLALSTPKTPRPDEHELEAFWRAVLDRCNDDRESFRFGAVIPERLRPQSGR